MHLYFFILIVASLCKGSIALSWHDVCDMTTRQCHVWPENPAPYNQLESYTKPGSVCDQPCVLILHSQSGPCHDFDSCGKRETGTTRHNLAAPIVVKGNDVTVVGPATLTIGLDVSNACTVFHVWSTKARFVNLTFVFSAACLEVQQATVAFVPLVFYRGGTVLVDTILFNGYIAAVLFLGSVNETLNASICNVVNLGHANFTYAVVFLNTNVVALQCDNGSSIFYLGREPTGLDSLPSIACTGFVNFSTFYEGVVVEPFRCPSSFVVVQTSCNKQSNTMLALIITSVVLVVAIGSYYFVEKVQISRTVKNGLYNAHAKKIIEKAAKTK